MPRPYYNDGEGIVIYHGDCREVLESQDCQERFEEEMVGIFDPPYGISHSSAFGASWKNTVIANDDTTDLRDWLVEWGTNIGIPMAVFGTWKARRVNSENRDRAFAAIAQYGLECWRTGDFAPPATLVDAVNAMTRPDHARGVLVWDKGPAFGMGDLGFPWKPSWEEIAIYGDGWSGRRDEGVLRGHIAVSWESKGRKHPHEKPVSLLMHVASKAPGLIVDPCCGSGSALRAAKELRRPAIGIEIEERYCEIAAERLCQEVLGF